MNWEALSAIAELCATIAVFISLIYLGVQIKSQGKESKLAAASSLSAGFNEFVSDMAANQELAAILIKGYKDLNSLDEVERLRFFSHMARMFRIFEGLHKHNLEGHLDDEIWGGVRAILKDHNEYPGIRDYWLQRRHWYNQRFQDWVNPILTGRN